MSRFRVHGPRPSVWNAGDVMMYCARHGWLPRDRFNRYVRRGRRHPELRCRKCEHEQYRAAKGTA